MGNLFGVRRRAPQVTAQDRTILQLKQQRDKIKIYRKRTESDLEKNAELALNLFQNGMKDRAIIVLRRKKMMEDILSRTDKQLETLEGLVSDIEYTQIEVSVVEGLKVGTDALKQLNNLMNIDDIQQMMDDNAEAAEKQREISAILQQTSERYDEDDLLKELEQYKKEAQPAAISTPEVTPAEAVATTTTADTIASDLDNLPNVPEQGEVLEPEQKTKVKVEEGEEEEYENVRPTERRKVLVDSS